MERVCFSLAFQMLHIVYISCYNVYHNIQKTPVCFWINKLMQHRPKILLLLPSSGWILFFTPVVM